MSAARRKVLDMRARFVEEDAIPASAAMSSGLRAAGAVRGEADRRLGAAQQALERAALDLLAEAAHLGRARLEHPEVGAHRAPLVGAEDLGEAVAVDRLDALHARPPARQVVRVAHGAPDLLGRRADRPAAAGRGHRPAGYSPS